MISIKTQIRNNLVALISLVVAFTSLGYNTWRNEQTEANRNVRNAGIEFLLKIGQLEETVFLLRYDREAADTNPRVGWAYVLTARDLAGLTRPSVMEAASGLFDVWRNNWHHIAIDDEAGDAVNDAIDAARAEMLAVLAGLD